jgi:hypothetical protein
VKIGVARADTATTAARHGTPPRCIADGAHEITCTIGEVLRGGDTCFVATRRIWATRVS